MGDTIFFGVELLEYDYLEYDNGNPIFNLKYHILLHIFEHNMGTPLYGHALIDPRFEFFVDEDILGVRAFPVVMNYLA